ncbi:hypothetical protein D3C77_397390 [compost metagenome]
MPLLDFLLLLSHRINRRLIHDAFQLRPRESEGLLRDLLKANTLLQRFILGMQLQYMHAAFLIRQINLDMAVKPSWAQQCCIQHLLAVRCCHQQNARRFRRIDAIHLR